MNNIQPIVQYGNRLLESPVASVVKFNLDLATLCDQMFVTMYANHGVGLAAPQVGINLRLAIIDISTSHALADHIILVNPELVAISGEEVNEPEGCLSLPGVRANVKRPQSVTVKAQNITGDTFEIAGDGLLARALCHEIDHLNGILFLRHLGRLRRELILKHLRKTRRPAAFH